MRFLLRFFLIVLSVMTLASSYGQEDFFPAKITKRSGESVTSFVKIPYWGLHTINFAM
jgi:hypothetical protein